MERGASAKPPHSCNAVPHASTVTSERGIAAPPEPSNPDDLYQIELGVRRACVEQVASMGRLRLTRGISRFKPEYESFEYHEVLYPFDLLHRSTHTKC